MASHHYAAVIRRTDRILRQVGSSDRAAGSAARTRAVGRSPARDLGEPVSAIEQLGAVSCDG